MEGGWLHGGGAHKRREGRIFGGRVVTRRGGGGAYLEGGAHIRREGSIFGGRVVIRRGDINGGRGA